MLPAGGLGQAVRPPARHQSVIRRCLPEGRMRMNLLWSRAVFINNLLELTLLKLRHNKDFLDTASLASHQLKTTTDRD